MPPDMTAGPMSLVGTPPPVTVSGKPATGPPGPDLSEANTLSTSLFASLLAQSAEPGLKPIAFKFEIPKQDSLKETTPPNLAAPPISQLPEALPVLTTPSGETLPPERISLPKINLLAGTKLPLTLKQRISGSLKTMDTVSALSPLPAEKGKEKTSELALPKASADTPGAASQNPITVADLSFSQPAALIPVPNTVPILLAPMLHTPPPLAPSVLPVSVSAVSVRQITIAPAPVQAASALGEAALPVEAAALPVEAAALPVEAAALPVEAAALPVEAAALPVEAAALPVEAAASPLGEAVVVSVAKGLTLPRTFVLTAPAAVSTVGLPQPAPVSAEGSLTASTAILAMKLSGATVLEAPLQPILSVPALRNMPLPQLPISVSERALPPSRTASAAPISLAKTSVLPSVSAETVATFLGSAPAAVRPAALARPTMLVQAGELSLTGHLSLTEHPSPDIAVPASSVSEANQPVSLNSGPVAEPHFAAELQISQSSQLPVVPGAIAPSAAPSILSPAVPSILSPAVPSISSTAVPIPPVAVAEQAAAVLNADRPTAKSPENTLKSPGANANNNTRLLAGTAPGMASKITAVSASPGLVSSETEKQGKSRETPDMPADSQIDVPVTAQAFTTAVEVPRSEARPLTAAERAEVVSQTVAGMGAMPLAAKAGGAEQMSLQLHPKDWGSLHVSVTLVPGTEAGAAKTVTAHIVAETPQIKAALQSQAGALHQALRASGLHLEHLTVSVKPMEPKTVEVKPTAQSASAGMSSGQGQSNANSQMQTSSSTTTTSNAGADSSSTASFTGGSQNGRQEQPHPAFAAAFEPEQEEQTRWDAPLRPAWGRIDTHA